MNKYIKIQQSILAIKSWFHRLKFFIEQWNKSIIKKLFLKK
jgi:hypothetical protein